MQFGEVSDWVDVLEVYSNCRITLYNDNWNEYRFSGCTFNSESLLNRIPIACTGYDILAHYQSFHPAKDEMLSMSQDSQSTSSTRFTLSVAENEVLCAPLDEREEGDCGDAISLCAQNELGYDPTEMSDMCLDFPSIDFVSI
ncbi:Hypothetical_protein [Hexamita inflata]|uniref:Hypothetical_protein n=1 Tax=Hexamita inflata TaxID=28002 RepID=A0AA86QJY3_9EUKA|nr:Hypothetical protein HINF_LOCUS42697 [Hexamita inflata]